MIGNYRNRRPWSPAYALAALLFPPALAHADDPPMPPPASAPPVVAPMTTPPPATPPPTAADAMPATRSDKLPPIDVGAWVRVAGRIQGHPTPDAPDGYKHLDDQSMDTIYAELHAGGKIHKNVSVTLNLNASGLDKPTGSTGSSTVGVMDAIIGFDFVDPFHLWIGQLLVPVDRSNGSGPFFMIPWNYPGFLTVGPKTVVTAPKEGPSGRNTGAVAWGDFAEGVFNYKAGIFNSADPAQHPLFSGRLNLAVVGKEPGFWGNGSYFGDKDIVAFGVGGQFQRKGSTASATPPAVAPAPDDYGEVNLDGLAEFKVGEGGWVTGEAAYYHFTGSNDAITDAMYVLAAYATPPVGIGNIQPMVRYQMGKGNNLKVWNLDAAVGYLIKGPALRATLGFQHVDLDNDVIGNAIQLGAQAIFF